MKKLVLIGVVVVCFVLAGAITLITHSSRTGDGRRTSRDKIWVMCRNPKCGAEHQIEYDDYFQYIVQHRDRFSDVEPPMTCEKCGEPSVYQAIKCAKCSLLLEPGSVPNDVEDKCPKCGYGTLQEQRELRKAQGAGK